MCRVLDQQATRRKVSGRLQFLPFSKLEIIVFVTAILLGISQFYLYRERAAQRSARRPVVRGTIFAVA